MVVDFAPVLARAQEGCQQSIAVIYRTFHPPLFRFLRFEEPAEAEDLAADVWMTIARMLVSFEGDERAFLAWMFTIARRRLIDTRRKRARRQTSPVAGFDDGLLPIAVRHPVDSTEARAVEGDALRRALSLLSPAQAEVVSLRLVCDLSVDEVATLVGRTPEAVRAMQHRGLRRLAAALRSSTADTDSGAGAVTP